MCFHNFAQIYVSGVVYTSSPAPHSIFHAKTTIMPSKIIILLLCILGWTACKNDSGVQEIRDGGGPNANLIRNPATADEVPADTVNVAKIVYEEKEYDFGTVKEGAIVEHDFKFTNTGKIPLWITGARSSCGCTIPEWPKEMIQPGGTSVISAKFNTEGKHNNQQKIIYVSGNTFPGETTVTLKGIVEPK